MSKVNCKDCQFYHNGRCEELGEYTTPGECECSWFAQKAIKRPCVEEYKKSATQTLFDRITQSPEVLAEKLVYLKELIFPDEIWESTLFFRQSFYSKEEAIAATVARLREVAE